MALTPSCNSYQCLFCDGHERKDSPKGVLTFTSPMYIQFALQQVSLTSNGSEVYVFCDGSFPKSGTMEKTRQTLLASGCIIEERRIERLVPANDGVDVVLEDGQEIFVGFLAHKPECKLVGEDMVKALGLEVEDALFGTVIKTQEPFKTTNVKGVFAAGDSVTPMKSVPNAMASGVNAAAGAANELVAEDSERALARHIQESHQEIPIDRANGSI